MEWIDFRKAKKERKYKIEMQKYQLRLKNFYVTETCLEINVQ